MKLWPKSLAGQLIAVLLFGLLATHWLVLHLSGKTQGSIHRISQDQVVERYATAYRVLASCHAPCDRATMLGALASHDARFSLSEGAQRELPMNATEARLADAVASALGRPAATGTRVRLQRADGDSSAPSQVSVDISTALPDGGRLVGVMWPIVRGGWWHLLAHGVLESAVAVFALVAIFVARLRRPLRAITEAYHSIGRGERVAPLSTTDGPRELREVASAFNLMQARLIRFVGERTRLLAAISHDIRTPLTSLRLRAELVDDDALRAAMVRTLDQLRQITEETVVFVREVGLHEASVRFDLARLVADLGSEQRALGRDVRWQTPSSLPYRGRPLALTRAVNNLLDNAVRYGRRVDIKARRVADGILLTVDDDGPGIAEDALQAVLEPFVRGGPAGTQAVEGLGLGLSIARTCVAAHGGSLSLENRRRGGLRASIALPA